MISQISATATKVMLPIVMVATTAVSLSGCSDATDISNSTNSNAYWALRLNVHAITLAVAAPFNTVQLTATPVTITGSPMTDAGLPTFSVSDSSVVVTSDGRVTGQFPTATNRTVAVIASLTIGATTLKDTAFVRVTSAGPTASLTTFSIQPLAGDSAAAAVAPFGGNSRPLTVTAATGGGVAAPVLLDTFPTYFTSADPSIASIDRVRGIVTSNVVGHVMLYASSSVYGVARRDSVVWASGYPLEMNIVATERTPWNSMEPIMIFLPSVVTIGVGGKVQWSNTVRGDTVDVVFDDPSAAMPACGILPWGCRLIPADRGGNIPDFYVEIPRVSAGLNQFHARSFPRAGTYHFHSERYGTTGTVVVKENPE
jgi:hypothetical protein